MRGAKTATLGLALLASLSPSFIAHAQRAADRRDAAVPFNVGETLTYDVSWSSMLVAGSATARIVEQKASANSTAYAIVVDGRPVTLLQKLYNLYYKMETLVDSVTLLSERGSLYSEEGADKRLGTTTFNRATRRAQYELQKDKVEKTEFAVPAGTQDGLAALYVLRARAFKAGETFTTMVADSGGVFSVPVRVGSPEQVRVPAGEFSAWPLTAEILDAQNQPVWKNIAVWISNDARRLPVRLQAELPVGHFVLSLRQAR